MTSVKAAIFDIGATLVTGPPIAPNKIIAQLIEGSSPTRVSDIIMKNDLKSAGQVCDALACEYGRLSDYAVSEIHELWQSQICAAQALDGAKESVLALKARGMMIGLLSDIWNPYFESVTKALPEVVAASDAIVLSCLSGSRKPDKYNFGLVVKELGVEPGECVMIGDTYTHDIRPALEMGMKAIWVLARPDREAEYIIKILNGHCLVPTATTADISQVASAVIGI
ncbi:HAD family hydrolase [bacterium]|nr:HAD family hydrolase [bacterium]